MARTIASSRIAGDDLKRLASRFAVLSDPTRLALLNLIATGGRACAACDLVDDLAVSQPTVSHHLRVLREAGFLRSTREGRNIYYEAAPEVLQELAGALGA